MKVNVLKLTWQRAAMVLALAMVNLQGIYAEEKTVWEGTQQISWNTDEAPGSQFETPEGTFNGLKSGDIVRIYSELTINAETGSAYGNLNYTITYKAGDRWSWTDLATAVNGGIVSFTVADDTQATEIANRGLVLRGQAWTATKITVESPDAGDVTYETVSIVSGQNVSTGNWENHLDLGWDNKGELANAQMNDKIRVTFAINEDGAHVCIANANGWSAMSEADVADATAYEYVISSAKDLETVQQNGILVRGKNITISAVDLLKASNRYDAVPLTIGEDGIATFGSSKSLDFSGVDGVTPYYASSVAQGTVTLTAVSATRGWAGYVVRGAAGDYDVPVSASEPDWLDAFNTLRYTGDYDGNWVYRSCHTDYTDKNADTQQRIRNNYRYIFAKDADGNIGFYKLDTGYTNSEGGPYHVLGAHKAYLETATDMTPASGVKCMALVFDSSTGVAAAPVAAPAGCSAAIYNLSGQRVQKAVRGIYIVGGRKVIVK